MKTTSSVLLTIMAVFIFLCSPCILFSAQVNIFGVTITPSVAPQAGVPLTVTVNASSTDGSPVYYKFYYCANYGTSAYATTPWTLVQDYSTDNTCNYTFQSEGDYIVVVRAVTNPNEEPQALPITGQTVTVTSDDSPAGNCGGYVAPGVWKELDCYNLAAIGKTTDDPCPVGYRVPSRSQWEGIRDNNTHGKVGSWLNYAANYSNAWFFGALYC